MCLLNSQSLNLTLSMVPLKWESLSCIKCSLSDLKDHSRTGITCLLLQLREMLKSEGPEFKVGWATVLGQPGNLPRLYFIKSHVLKIKVVF